jgi:signal peptidase I
MFSQTAAHANTPLRIPAEPRGGTRRRRRGRAARVASSTLLGGVVVLILVTVAGMALDKWRFTVIDTGSMRPTLNPGDVAVLTSERLTDVQKGQIVAFHPPGERSLTVVHRVFSIRRAHGGLVIQTKGDANNATDPWRARLVDSTVWRETLKVPKVGYLAAWSQQRPIRLGLLFAIVVLLVAMMLGWIWRSAP